MFLFIFLQHRNFLLEHSLLDGLSIASHKDTKTTWLICDCEAMFKTLDDTWFWCLILTLDFDAWFWHLILTLDFDTWFWWLILMDEFDDKLVSQMDVQMDVRTTLTLESLHDWKTHFHFSRFYLLNKIIRFFTYTLILTATRATSEITKIFLKDTF